MKQSRLLLNVLLGDDCDSVNGNGVFINEMTAPLTVAIGLSIK